MLGLDFGFRPRGQPGLPFQNRWYRHPFPEIGLGVFGNDFTVAIQNQRAGIGDAEGKAIRLDGLVQEPVGANGLRTQIAEQREGDPLPRGELRQDLRRIVTDSRKPDFALVQFRQIALQLDQLRFAVGSPIGRPVENDDRSVFFGQRSEGARTAALVRQRKPGDHGSDRRAPLGGYAGDGDQT